MIFAFTALTNADMFTRALRLFDLPRNKGAAFYLQHTEFRKRTVAAKLHDFVKELEGFPLKFRTKEVDSLFFVALSSAGTVQRPVERDRWPVKVLSRRLYFWHLFSVHVLRPTSRSADGQVAVSHGVASGTRLAIQCDVTHETIHAREK